MEPRSSTLQVDSLLSETSGKPKKTGVGGLSLPQRMGLPKPGSDQGLLHCRRIPYQLSYQGSPKGLNSTILLIVSTNSRHNLSRKETVSQLGTLDAQSISIASQKQVSGDHRIKKWFLKLAQMLECFNYG